MIYSRCYFLLFALICTTALSTNSTFAQQMDEQELLKTLNSEATKSEKAVACKQLAIFGTEAAVPELEKLLPDPQLSSWARTAIEAIPGEASNQALRNAAKTLSGRPQIGAVNSLGVRQDAASIDLLAELLNSDSESLASAAAFSLGKIGGPKSATTLRNALGKTDGKVRSAVAHGCIVCADSLLKAGKSTAAVALYETVRQADVPKQRIIEATRGTILASTQDQGTSLLIAALLSDDKSMFQLALGTIREFPGSKLDSVLVKQLDVLPQPRAALLIRAMADRKKTVNVQTILAAAKGGEPDVQVAAIESLQMIGDESCLEVLFELAIAPETEIATAARATLAKIPGEQINRRMVERLEKAQGKVYPVLLTLVGQRQIAAVNQVAEALDSKDQAVRLAALFALGETVNQKQLSILITELSKSKSETDRQPAAKALTTASIRMPDADRCTAMLVAAMKSEPNIANDLLETIGAVGGPAALKALSVAAKSADADQQDIASRLLGKWNNASAAPVLLDLAKTAPAKKFQIRALRGYIGIARKFPMSEEQRVQMCRKAIEAAQRNQEKELVLDVLKVRPSQFGLELANELKQDSALRDQATATAEEIRKKVGR